jgi:hypothetical protein
MAILPISRSTAAILISAAVLTTSAGGTAAAPPGPDEDPLEQALRALQGQAEAAGAVGMYEADDGAYVVVLPRKANATALADISVEGRPVRVERSSVTAADVIDIQNFLAGYAWSAAPQRPSFTAEFDAKSKLVVVRSNASQQAFAQVFERFPDKLRYEFTPGEFVRLSRYSDGAPHRGGAEMKGRAKCTTGFTVSKGGPLFLVTAGHCYLLGDRPYSPGNGLVFGQVNYRASFPQRDMELVGGGSYTNAIYVGNLTGSSMTVTSAADTVWSYNNYCYSGAVTAENCGKTVYSTNAVGCDDLGNCTFGMVSLTGGGMPLSGDSGAPLYTRGSSVGIRGLTIGKQTNIMFAEKWSTIVNTFGVTIYTGQ